MGNTSRRKGHDYERQIRKEFIELGYDECQTSRYASKETDDKGIDLVGTDPWAVQCKCYAKSPNYKKVLSDMQTEPTQMKLLFHKVPKVNDEYVIMEKADFMEILQALRANKIF